MQKRPKTSIELENIQAEVFMYTETGAAVNISGTVNLRVTVNWWF